MSSRNAMKLPFATADRTPDTLLSPITTWERKIPKAVLLPKGENEDFFAYLATLLLFVLSFLSTKVALESMADPVNNLSLQQNSFFAKLPLVDITAALQPLELQADEKSRQFKKYLKLVGTKSYLAQLSQELGVPVESLVQRPTQGRSFPVVSGLKQACRKSQKPRPSPCFDSFWPMDFPKSCCILFKTFIFDAQVCRLLIFSHLF